MVCQNELQHVAINWDEKTIYGFVVEPTERERHLVDAINSLPRICRHTVILFVFSGMQRAEIAGRLKTSVGVVRFLIHRSGLLLREHIVERESANTRYLALNTVFSCWPWLEYAELVQLQKHLVLW